MKTITGNILDLDVDCIVNPTNPALSPGGGLSGAIHAAGGQNLYLDLLEAYPLGLHTGEATRPMPGHLLKAKWVIHAVGPKNSNVARNELLWQTYYNVLEEAMEHNIKSIALPLISSGIYGVSGTISKGQLAEVMSTCGFGQWIDIFVVEYQPNVAQHND